MDPDAPTPLPGSHPGSHAGPRPDNALETEVLIAIRRILRAVDQNSRRLLDNFGLTAPQLAALRTLEGAGPMRPSALAKSLHLSHPTVTGILARLEVRGLVERTPGAADRRTLLVALSAAGREIVGRAPSLLQDRFRRELGQLARWEQLAILSNLERVAALMEAEHLDAAPHLVTHLDETTGGADRSPASGAADDLPSHDPHPQHTA